MFHAGESVKIGFTSHALILRYLRRDTDGEDVYECMNPINGRVFTVRGDLLRRYN